MSEKELSKLIVEALSDKKAKDIIEIYVGGLTAMTDYFIICTGTSDRHMRTMADSVVENMAEHGISPLHREGKNNAHWILLDYGDAVVNIFDAESRKTYNLERLWADGEITRIEEMMRDQK